MMGCKDPNKTTGIRESSPGTIHIGVNPWPGYLGLYLAEKKKFFAEEGLDVVIKNYGTLAELREAYVAGSLQGCGTPVVDAVKYQKEGVDHRIILALDFSNGSDAVVAKESIAGPSDLIGKRIAFEPGSVTEFHLSYVLQQYGHTLKDIIPVHAGTQSALTLLLEGEVDASVTYEPHLSKILESGGFHVIYSSREAPGLILDALSLKKDFIDTYPDAALRLAKAYFKALDFIRENPTESHSLLASLWRTSPETIKIQLEGVQIPDFRENLNTFAVGSSVQSIYGNTRRVHEYISRNFNWLQPFDQDAIIDRSILRRLRRGNSIP